jgi:hypothetical protein
MTPEERRARKAKAERARRARLKQAAAGPDAGAAMSGELEALLALDPATLVVTNEAGEPTELRPAGLRLVELLAVAFPGDKGLPFIARNLNLHRSQLKLLMTSNRGLNAVQKSWERGDALASFKHFQLLMSHSALKFIAAIFTAKGYFSVSERDQPSVVVNQNAISYVLPGGQSREDYYRSLGITGPVHVEGSHIRVPAPIDVTPPQIEKSSV